MTVAYTAKVRVVYVSGDLKINIVLLHENMSVLSVPDKNCGSNRGEIPPMVISR
jgi:hypothetical protein